MNSVGAHIGKSGQLRNRQAERVRLSNDSNLSVSEARLRRRASVNGASVRDLVPLVFLRRNPFQVVEGCVGSIAVKVRSYMALRRWTNEGFKNQAVNGLAKRTVSIAHPHARISTSEKGLQHVAFCGISYGSRGRRFVTGKVLNWLPVFHASTVAQTALCNKGESDGAKQSPTIPLPHSGDNP